MERIEDQKGLASGEGWYEIAYATGEQDWPLARVRVTPVKAEQEDRQHQPNSEPVPMRVQVRMSASLIDEEGAVERLNGKLILGTESIHSWQFEAEAGFEPAVWLDQCAERMITDLIRKTRGLAAAAEAGLLLN